MHTCLGWPTDLTYEMHLSFSMTSPKIDGLNRTPHSAVFHKGFVYGLMISLQAG